MSNVRNHNFHNLKFIINDDENWDLFLDKDGYHGYYDLNSNRLNEECLSAYIDMSEYDCEFENSIYSLPQYKWENRVTSDKVLKNVGYTGFDNGLLHFRKDKIMNSDFVKLYQNSVYNLNNNDVLQLHQVTGSTMVYEYPLTFEDNFVKLNGGFFQGFIKTKCNEYQVLPTDLNNGDTWVYEFTLKPSELEKESYKTLNDKYPNNKGIFFYLGTRAENKWVYLYDEDYKDECFTLSPDDYVEGGEIDKKTYKIDAFLDMSFDMGVEWESIAMDDYLSHKYYNESLYNHTCQSSDSFDDYIDDDIFVEKPIIIDEDKNKGKTIDWCCSYFNQETYEMVRTTCCSACCHEVVDLHTITTKKGGYFSKCEVFGDDYLSDIDSLEYITDFIEDDLDISDFTYMTDGLLTIGKFESYIDTDNKFLLFHRGCDGFNVHNWTNGITMRYVMERRKFNGNLFLLMNRTCTGHTVYTIEDLKKEYAEEYNIVKDLYNNALAFRIKDDGSIGYRYLVQDCDNDEGYKILEGYSKEGLIKKDEWSVITVKISAHFDTMVLRFYVNGKLIFISKALPKLDLRDLDDALEKQETVPYNMSIGGGTQGLADTILPNYMLEPYRVFPLEENFAGTFIGYFKSFKFYSCDMEYMNILSNFKYEIDNLRSI